MNITPASFLWNVKKIRLINGVLMGFMLVCFMTIVIQVVERALPDWNGSIWVAIAGLMAIEAYRTRILISSRDPHGPGGLVYYLVEWVVILVLIKAFTYIIYPTEHLIWDISHWSENFLETFLTPAYIGSVILCVLAYVISGLLANELLTLENDEVVLDQEKAGIPGSDRFGAYHRLAGVIFFVGGAMLALSALLNVNIGFLPKLISPIRPYTFALIGYFLAGLTLLAFARYSMKEAHWYLVSTPVDHQIGKQWLWSIGALLSVVSLVVLLLPTSYSLGLLDILARVYVWLMNILLTISVFICTPFGLLLALIASLLGVKTETLENTEPSDFNFRENLEQQTQSLPWMDELRAIFFWLVFLAVIVISTRMYLKYNNIHFNGLKKLAKVGWIRSFWLWLTRQARSVKRHLDAVIETSAKQARRFFLRGKEILEHPIEMIEKNLPPRQRVMLMYTRLVRDVEGFGIERKKAETPIEYKKRVSSILEEARQELDTLTNHFIEARYSNHPIIDTQVEEMTWAAENIRKTGQQYLAKNQSLAGNHSA